MPLLPRLRGARSTDRGQSLTPVERFAKGVFAGVDQFGGVNDPAMLLDPVRSGRVSEAQIDQSVSRILGLKFELGLFDDPYVDPVAAVRIVNDPRTHAAGRQAQARAQVLLENREGALPIASGRRVWLSGLDADEARARGLVVVNRPEDADVALIRVDAPHEVLHPHHFFGSRQNEGRLNFLPSDPDFQILQRAAAAAPTVIIINLDRPAIQGDVRRLAQGLIATFGAGDDAVFEVLTGRAKPEGRLPFDLPSSMAEVEAQDPARSDDTPSPLYRRGAGATGVMLHHWRRTDRRRRVAWRTSSAAASTIRVR